MSANLSNFPDPRFTIHLEGNTDTDFSQFGELDPGDAYVTRFCGLPISVRSSLNLAHNDAALFTDAYEKNQVDPRILGINDPATWKFNNADIIRFIDESIIGNNGFTYTSERNNPDNNSEMTINTAISFNAINNVIRDVIYGLDSPNLGDFVNSNVTSIFPPSHNEFDFTVKSVDINESLVEITVNYNNIDLFFIEQHQETPNTKTFYMFNDSHELATEAFCVFAHDIYNGYLRKMH